MTHGKVMLPRKVADALERLSCYDIALIRSNGENSPESDYGIIHDWIVTRGNVQDYFSALVNGYNVEVDPHEQLRKYYESIQTPGCNLMEGIQLNTIRKTLELLEIEVEGINDGTWTVTNGG